ncbi:MAG: hypothetical protein JO250_11930 [Armatimonadetes bacterium]|nr:hypothetical protein [Armatimonadota bacterium]
MLTPDAELRHVLNAAQWEADRQNMDIAAPHLLLGLFHPPLSGAGRALMALGVRPNREKLTGAPTPSGWTGAAPDETIWPPPITQAPPPPPRDIHLSRDAAEVLALAEREARARRETRLTPAHLVIGLLEHRRGAAYLLLRMHHIDVTNARVALYA